MAEVHIEEHSSPIKTPKQLAIVVALAFLVPITLIVMLSQLVTLSSEPSKNNPGMSEEAVAKRLKPVGEVVVAEPSKPKTAKSGKEIVEAVCSACHATGALNSPKIGDKAAWATRISQGEETLTQAAIKGIGQMPPRGGNSALTDLEVARAVVYMANQGGANWREPTELRKPAAVIAGRTGEQIVQAQCSKCHETGKMGAPRMGDRPAWIKRAKQGIDAVTLAAIRGHGNMPARGGMAELTDAEFKRAVIYMFNQGTGKKQPAPPAPAPAAAETAKGKAVFEATCVACHGTGLAGAPKTGNKAAWAPRIKNGMDALYKAALHGLNAMPPKGGNPALSDDDVKAAVDYMVGLVK